MKKAGECSTVLRPPAAVSPTSQASRSTATGHFVQERSSISHGGSRLTSHKTDTTIGRPRSSRDGFAEGARFDRSLINLCGDLTIWSGLVYWRTAAPPRAHRRVADGAISARNAWWGG